jgi:hypothetical protein
VIATVAITAMGTPKYHINFIAMPPIRVKKRGGYNK